MYRLGASNNMQINKRTHIGVWASSPYLGILSKCFILNDVFSCHCHLSLVSCHLSVVTCHQQIYQNKLNRTNIDMAESLNDFFIHVSSTLEKNNP